MSKSWQNGRAKGIKLPSCIYILFTKPKNMKEININIEGYNVNGICVGCLNYNRKMYYRDEVKECYKVLGNIDVSTIILNQLVRLDSKVFK